MGTELLAAIQDVCSKYDLRVGQLIDNALHYEDDLFLLKDEVLLSRIKALIKDNYDISKSKSYTEDKRN